MLIHASGINGYAIKADDGHLGTVSDLLFDDASWLVRWLVVDTGNWLSGRKVLLPPLVLGHPDAKKHLFPVRLTKQQVRESPEIDTERPVSRQMETSVYDYYGWSPFWGTGFYMGGHGYMPGYMPGYMGGVWIPPAALGSGRRAPHIVDDQRTDDDPHLRSIEAVGAYHVLASDGEIGHIEDFLVDDTDWSIHYLVVDTKNWWPGKLVLISPRSAREIDWTEKTVRLDVTRQKVKGGPEYDASTIVDRAYEKRLHSHYSEA